MAFFLFMFLATLPRADAVVVADVVRVHPAPAMWSSGRVATYQRVDYQVVKVVEGEAPARISVEHLILKGKPGMSRTAPGLDPARFKPGARFTLRLIRDGDRLFVDDPVNGAQPAPR